VTVGTRVVLTVTGETGSGKSRILFEIETALLARGIVVSWTDPTGKGEGRAEAWAEAHGAYQPEFPEVVLQEINVPIINAFTSDANQRNPHP
jgi:hypothetical protein